MGRKGVFYDEDIKKNFLSAIKLGLSYKKACDYAGISEPTIYAWINKAEEDEMKGKKDSVYVKFLKEFKKAKSEFTMRHVMRITQASDDGSWQASAWLLERRCPDEFALRNDINISNEKITVISDMPTSEEEGE